MKIGLITATFNNFGSRLQNIASIILLKKQYPNSKVETIWVYKAKNKFIFYACKLHIIKFFVLWLKTRGKINKNNKLLHIHFFVVANYTIKSLKFLDKKYDLFVIGSDQIWNNLSDVANFKFGMFTNNKICNAPSFIPERVSDNNKLKSLLSTFKDLNVREEKTAQFVNKNYGLKCQTLIDPTLRLPVGVWNELISNYKWIEKDYIFVYFLQKKEKFMDVCKELESKNIKFIALFNKNDGNENYKFSPLEFISIIKNSSSVITNSFHGCCFAEIFDKPLTIYKHNESSDIRYDVFKEYKNLKGIF